MNRLDPNLKKLMRTAGRAEEPLGFEPSETFIHRILRQAGAPADPTLGVLEFMVNRSAAIAALVGIGILSAQMLAGSESAGLLKYVTAHGGVMLRSFLP